MTDNPKVVNSTIIGDGYTMCPYCERLSQNIPLVASNFTHECEHCYRLFVVNLSIGVYARKIEGEQR